jgi:leucyl-tRNA synthetase
MAGFYYQSSAKNIQQSNSTDSIAMEYQFSNIEDKWQSKWKENDAYKVSNESNKPKFYVLDMFPYPSGAGLHVGHPLGYIASDIYARFKRLKGFNVLHPMGYDSFGLPAEQYALETGQHPAVTTEKNIATFRSQLDKIGFCFDWSREVKTSDPAYYKWTQWIFLQIFDSWYNRKKEKAERINELVNVFEKEGNITHECPGNKALRFSAAEWKVMNEKQQQEILMNYRLAFSSYGEVNWCEALGTVLANDEVINGVSERGGHPVIKKKMRQWYLRITEYANRLLEGLEKVEFSDSLKEQQRNWIGKSYGAEVGFELLETSHEDGGSALTAHSSKLIVYTTRPDTIFGVDFMVLAPEHELVAQITTPGQKDDIDKYLHYVKSRSDRERMAEVKQITGCFTGAYAINPFDGKQIPIWIAEYVLAGYGTGAIMAVPCGDQRDYDFAKHFNIPITNIIGEHYNAKEANPTKEAVLTNSGFLTGLVMKDAIEVALQKITEMGIGKRQINYKMRDAGFSRQRYWGEPFPIIWQDGVALPLDAEELPLELPYVDKYGPGPEGEGPLANLKEWTLIPGPSPQAEKGAQGAANVPKYSIKTPLQFELAKQNRKEYTEAEGIMWEALRAGKLDVKFRRQHPIDTYIADFICLQQKLIIEVDGGYHETEEQKLYDQQRTKTFEEIGFKVIRFSNDEVINKTSFVLNEIKQILREPSSPLSTRGEGLGVRETSTMPGYAGSSWYFLRYMDPHNESEFCNRKVSDYWNQVDLYIGGTEHAVGHLLYSRLWTKILYDLNYIGHDEPYKKLLNQGMIQGSSRFVYRLTYNLVYRYLEDILTENFRAYDFRRAGDSFVSDNEKLIVEVVPMNMIRNKSENDLLINTTNLNYRKILLIAEILFTRIQDKQEIDNFIIYGIKNRENMHNDYDFIYSNWISGYAYYVSKGFLETLNDDEYTEMHVDVKYVDGVILDCEQVQEWRTDFHKAYFVLEDGKYICGTEVEKMSKSKYNTVNPDDLVSKFGADTFRMYEMFLGPVEQSKPWDTKGIEGVHRFLRKLWRLFFDDTAPLSLRRGAGGEVWNEDKATDAELKILHRTIKKIEEDTERFSFNTAVSAFMIAVNDLADAKCHKREILEPLLILLTPYAPHICEELWSALGNTSSILDASYPVLENKYLVETAKEYPVSVNGKTRTNITIALAATQDEVEKMVLDNEIVQKWMDGKPPKRIIYVKGKMVNVVV